MHSSGKKPELLAPAGDMERLQGAVNFGADAVYVGGKQFGMRAAPSNFNFDELKDAVEYAHQRNVQVYFTCNTLPRNQEVEQLSDFIHNVAACCVDAFIVTDIGVFMQLKKLAPDIDVHVSTQAGIVNYLSANTFYNLGASRVVLARELTLEEIAEIRAKTPAALELEAFVHGSMCVSFSGRCLLSNYLTGRDSNRGDCAQPCRWKYTLMEEKRPGEYYPIEEDDAGTYIMNAYDLCMAEHIPALIAAGIDSFKLEGRAKSAYYTSVVTNAYRNAIDEYWRNPSKNFTPSDWVLEELDKVSHRKYGTGFFFGRPSAAQNYESSSYIRKWEVAGIVLDSNGMRVTVSQRNRFFNGEELSVLVPGEPPFLVKALDLTDEEGNPIDSANKAVMNCSFQCSRKLPKGAILRKKNEA